MLTYHSGLVELVLDVLGKDSFSGSTGPSTGGFSSSFSGGAIISMTAAEKAQEDCFNSLAKGAWRNDQISSSGITRSVFFWEKTTGKYFVKTPKWAEDEIAKEDGPDRSEFFWAPVLRWESNGKGGFKPVPDTSQTKAF